MFHFQVSDDGIDYVQFTSASETSSSTSAATMRTSTAESSLEAAFQGSEHSSSRTATGTEEEMLRSCVHRVEAGSAAATCTVGEWASG